MKIKIINPNTTQSMTDKIAASAKVVASSGTQIIAVSPQMGPATIESYYDEALSAVGVLEEIRQGELLGVDAYVIACFGDPALYAAREMTSAPVIGIAEAATPFCKNVRACDIAVEELELPDSDAYRTIRDECKKALAEDKSDAIVLGCAGMSDLCLKLQNELGVIVIDGVAAAVKQAEMLVQLNLKTSKVGDWASPPVKNYTGILSGFGMR
ncbi:TPA: aspartate/glutamate racemase family protein [Acinetobacter baumannii]|nr:aspartate/glutamate racemase family protein [Acinetobacter baumannii]